MKHDSCLPKCQSAETAKKLGLRCHSKGTMVTIEGPRFSSRAESFMLRTWGADVINMTTVPEVVLAKEAGICYASIAMATDYDCWKEHEEAEKHIRKRVSVDRVLKTLKENANKAKSLLLTTIPQIGSLEWSETLHSLKNDSLALWSPRVTILVTWPLFTAPFAGTSHYAGPEVATMACIKEESSRTAAPSEWRMVNFPEEGVTEVTSKLPQPATLQVPCEPALASSGCSWSLSSGCSLRGMIVATPTPIFQINHCSFL
ncbi:hypothetical protein P7K49_001231 [Saguinus oedipus]|uniref:Nucleoside phosphorylase domain-containing protein n=1 Tax=Saguinus oedipus TaxID=9490 RepID=A0ABQ9WED2_SAGOE|nr:hypothetical protein P7K49_001231 [Saguinus oedipus]